LLFESYVVWVVAWELLSERLTLFLPRLYASS
jgi:hypothetical protein